MRVEEIILNKERNVIVKAYIQEVDGEFGFQKRPAMIVLPGGGYAMCSEREADSIAFAYMKAGYQAFILYYSVGQDKKWPQPLEDYETLMEQIDKNQEEWHVDMGKIATVGFSAGGHLAACIASMAKHKPAASILVYPAILKDITELCAIKNLPEAHTAVTAATTPCFIAATRDDSVVSIKNALSFELALADKEVPFESHIYSYGNHGFSSAEEWLNMSSVSERTHHWMEDSIGWLKEILGTFTRNGFTEPNIAVRGNGNTAPVLSVSCTLSHIRTQNEEVQSILKPLYEGMELVAQARGYSIEGLMNAVGGNTIRELMENVNISQEQIHDIDKQLHNITNQL